MSYPIEILSQQDNKYIDCNLSDFVLARFTRTCEKSEYFDEDFKTIKINHIVYSDNDVLDFSTNLLGIYKLIHVKIKFLENGVRFQKPWNLGESSEIPVLGEEFELDDNRGYWLIKIGEIDGIKIEYKRGDAKELFPGYLRIKHTPILGNFWHFSIKLDLPNEPLDLSPSLKKKLSKLIRHELISTLSILGFIACENIPILPHVEFKKNNN